MIGMDIEKNLINISLKNRHNLDNLNININKIILHTVNLNEKKLNLFTGQFMIEKNVNIS